MKTQCERIIDFMNAHGSITPMEAFADLGITKLATRIGDLRKKGYAIKGEMVKSKNRFGEECHYKQYSLMKEGA